jgi:hypothetical protein
VPRETTTEMSRLCRKRHDLNVAVSLTECRAYRKRLKTRGFACAGTRHAYHDIRIALDACTVGSSWRSTCRKRANPNRMQGACHDISRASADVTRSGDFTTQ